MAEAPNLKVINPDGPRELIMVVDDDELVMHLVERLLASEGYRIV